LVKFARKGKELLIFKEKCDFFFGSEEVSDFLNSILSAYTWNTKDIRQKT